MVKDIQELSREIQPHPFRGVEVLVDGHIDVVDRARRWCVASRVGISSGTRLNVAGVGIGGHPGNDVVDS